MLDFSTTTTTTTRTSRCLLLPVLLWLSTSSRTGTVVAQDVVVADYGVDCSFPIHSFDLDKCGGRLGDRQTFYENFMAGCRKFYGRHGQRCDATEEDRVAMSLRQPQSMVNYTSTGFKKIRAPQRVMDLLLSHYHRNKDSKKMEVWGSGSTYVNNWESPTYMISVEDTTLRGGGSALKQKIWDAVKPTIEEWTGMEQQPSSQYGIRMYTEGAVLNPHVDRLPLVSSCIINVDQDLDEDWVLEVIDRQGRAVNVTMHPGDMVLYESGSLIHGRPYPLKGRYYANIFIHFHPTGRKLGDKSDDYLEELDDFYPPYIVPGSPEEAVWAQRNPQGWRKPPSPATPGRGGARGGPRMPVGHHAAATGDLEELQKLAHSNAQALHSKDQNGWRPIHEAVRSGHTHVVEFLAQQGADINARTGPTGKGQSPLALAKDFHDDQGSLIQLLVQLGAQEIDNEL